MTLFESVFAGNDAVYGLTEGAINQAIEKYGAYKQSASLIQHILYHATMQ